MSQRQLFNNHKQNRQTEIILIKQAGRQHQQKSKNHRQKDESLYDLPLCTAIRTFQFNYPNSKQPSNCVTIIMISQTHTRHKMFHKTLCCYPGWLVVCPRVYIQLVASMSCDNDLKSFFQPVTLGCPASCPPSLPRFISIRNRNLCCPAGSSCHVISHFLRHRPPFTHSCSDFINVPLASEGFKHDILRRPL